MRVSALILSALVVLAAGVASGGTATIAFTGAIVFERDPGPGSDIYLSTAPGVAVPLVATPASEFDPALARDGRVAFARAEGERSEIFVFDGGRVTQVTEDGAVDQHPAWSPRGDRIAYSSDKGKGADIVEVRVGDPSSARAVAPAPGDDFTPSYARDGRLAFASNRSGNFELYVLENAKLTRLTRDHDTELSPAWSPDGKQLALTRIDGRGNAEIWTLTVATRVLTRLTTNPADDSDPSFSPDGSQVAFVSDRSGAPAIWTMPAKAGAKAEPLGELTPAVNLGPSWGPKAPVARRALRVPAHVAVSITCPAAGTFAGTSGPDMIDGSDTASDTICGLAGNDKLRGLGKNDTLSGGAGVDTVLGGNDNDPIVSGGSTAGDQVNGGAGDDKLYARDGAVDQCVGGTGYDRAQVDSSPSADTKTGVEGTIA